MLVVTSDPTYEESRVIRLFLCDGPAAKRNFGTDLARAEIIVYLDDDVEISPYCLYEFWKWMTEHPQCGMAFAKILKMEEGRRDEFDDAGSWLTVTGFLWARAGNRQRDTGQFDHPTRCLASKSATCAIRRTVFHVVGGFDAGYFILGEDSDLAWRVWLRSWECWYVPTAVSWHAFGCESLKPKADYYTITRTMRYGARNYLRVLTTNLGLGSLLWTLPWHLLAWTVATLGFLARGDGRRALAIGQGVVDYLTTLPATLSKRRRVQTGRVVADRTLLPLISYRPPLLYYLTRMRRYLTTQLHG